MIERLDRELKKKHLQARLACGDPMGSEVTRVEYEYGRRIGVGQGLQMAIDILADVIRDDKRKEPLR